MHRNWLSLSGAAFGALAILLLTQAAQAGYEGAPTFSAGQALQGIPLRGPNYSIGDRVTVDNFQYVFRLTTKWGPFTVKGSDLLRVRLREIAATAKLEEIGGAETFVGSAGRTALRPLATAKDLVTDPGQTLSDTVKGMGNLFGSVDASMSATDPHKESVVASVTGGATARRKLAFDFGVDPNTSFPPLDAELTRLATASAVGETTSNAGLAFVTGGAGIAISVGGTSRQLRVALRDKTAAQLEKDGRAALAAMGVSQATMDAFYGNPNLSPTDKAIIVDALNSLGSTGGREIFVAGAANAQSIEMGFFYRRQAELIAAFNKKISHVSAFARMGGAPLLQTGRGTVSVLPVDYLFWSPPLAGLVAGAGRGGEVWITGRGSNVATSQLASLGWTLQPRAGGKLGQ